MSCGPGQVSGPGAVPFWSTCYDIHSDMGQHLTASAPTFRAELSDPNYVWRQFGKPPKDQAGRERLAVSGPALRDQLQASLNALHPVLGKDEVASALFSQGQKMLATLRGLTPDTAALHKAMKTKIGDAAAHYAPEVLKQFYDEETKQKLLGYVAAITAPLAVKYGGLVRALNGAVAAGAVEGASVLIAGIWAGWVQERLGEQMNELHATSGTLSDAAQPDPWQGYAPGDWVAMRELIDRAWVARIGLVLDGGDKTNRRYKRYRVAVLPTGAIVGRGAAHITLMDQQGMRRAESLDPKLRFWRAAMAVKNRAELTRGCPVRRRMMKNGADGPTGNSCSFGPMRRRDAGERAAAGQHEQAGPPAPAPKVPVKVEKEQWEADLIEAESVRLRGVADYLTSNPDPVLKAKWHQELQANEEAKAELWQRRSTMEQRSERILTDRGIRRLEQATLFAHPGGRLVAITHVDGSGQYYFRSGMGGLRQLPKGLMVVDTKVSQIPPEWQHVVDLSGLDAAQGADWDPKTPGITDTDSDPGSDMDAKLGAAEAGDVEATWGRQEPVESRATMYAAAAVVLLLGFLLVNL